MLAPINGWFNAKPTLAHSRTREWLLPASRTRLWLQPLTRSLELGDSISHAYPAHLAEGAWPTARANGRSTDAFTHALMAAAATDNAHVGAHERQV